MTRIALKMLFHRRGTYAAMVFGISFAVLLVTQLLSILLGLMERSTGPLQNIGIADVWVGTPQTKNVMTARWMHGRALHEVRSIPGVEWAEPFFFAIALAELPDGSFEQIELVGVDRETLIGRPPRMTEGSVADLRGRDAIFVEASLRHKLPGAEVGTTIAVNEQRARVVGICRAETGILSRPLIYTTYDNALRLVPNSRNRVHWILVKVRPGADVQEVCDEVERRTGLSANQADELRRLTMHYVLWETSMGTSFLLCVTLGVFVGLVISAATFHQFTSENLSQFAVLKAVGTSSRQIVAMVAVQALTAGAISYGIGVGLAGVVNLLGRRPDAQLVMLFPWQLLVIAVIPVLCCVALGSMISLRRVLRVDPVVVFQ